MEMSEHERKVARRRAVIATLDELARAGMINYTLSHRNLDGPEPHLEVTARREALGASTEGLSAEACAMWVLLMVGDLRGFGYRAGE